MNRTLIIDGFVFEQELLNLGFSKEELTYLLNKKILSDFCESKYYVNNEKDLKIFILKKLLQFDRTILTYSELDYLNISELDKKRIFSYGIAKKIDSNRFMVVDDVEKLKLNRPEIDIIFYKQLYEENLKKGNYNVAKSYLEKYIEICEVLNIEGDYYYKLTHLNNKIERQKLTIYQLREYKRLIKKYVRLKSQKNYAYALTIIYDCYNLNPGSMEATSIAEMRIALKKTNYEKILRFLTEAVEKDKTNPATYKYLGEIYLKINNYKEACSALEQYINLDKNCNYDGYYSLFYAYIMNNDIAKAHKVFSDAIAIIPEKNIKKFIKSCIKLTNKCINSEVVSNKDNYVRLTDLNNLKATMHKQLSYGINDFLIIEKEKEEYAYIERAIEELLKPNENNIVDIKKIDSYIMNLEVSDEEKTLIILRSGLVLARNNYLEKAYSYVRLAEKTENKTKKIIEQLDNTRKELKLIKRKI